MGDKLLELVEQKMKTNLCLEAVTRPNLKSNLPFTIINTEGMSPVLHLFEIVHEKSIFDASSSNKPKFGVVTMNGCITVYDTMFRLITWKRQTSLGKVSWGILSWGKNEYPVIMMHSRQCGFHSVKPLKSENNAPSNNLNELLSNETHIGFCKPYLCSDQETIIVPLGSEKIGIYTLGEQSIRVCHTFSSTIMAIKEISTKDSFKYIMCTTEDGKVTVIQAVLDPSAKLYRVSVLAEHLLPNYQDTGQQPIGLCIDGYNGIYVIGSNLKYMFLMKWCLEEPSRLTPFGKKILPTEGVSYMALRQGKGILAAGCFDGTVRIFGFPEMNQISTINYHKTQINTLLFINENVNKDGRWYLLCGASDMGLSVWNIPVSKLD